MNHKKMEDIYNVNNYTEKELLDMLDLYNPSDRELEAKIIQLINKYDNIGNDAALDISKFYRDIYDYFFLDSDDEEDENEENNSVGNAEIQREGFELIGTNKGSGLATNLPNENTNAQNIITTTTDNNVNNVNFTQSFQYSKDKINPVLKETIKRIISIDSQFRDVRLFPLTTSFSFNLSEPLHDVVSLKLYSVQIPYTWYTINNNFGSNFFYLKGYTDGINSGNYDIQIYIPPGNYTPTTLTTAVNNSINDLKLIYSDISFGNTKMIYNDINSRTTLSIDLQQIYNQSEYYISFPSTHYGSNFTYSPYSNYDRQHSIQAFLGFENNIYSLNSIYSSRTIPLTTTNDRSVYFVSNENNYFTIYNYKANDGLGFDISNSYVFNKIIVQFDPTIIIPGSLYTRNQLSSALNMALMNNIYIDTANTTIGQYTTPFPHSQIIRIDISGINIFTGGVYDPSTNGLGESYYGLSLKLNRFKIDNEINTRTAVIFPDESTISKPIWTGNNSAFQFLNRQNEINYLYSETYITNTNYIINDNVRLELICTKNNYGKLPPEVSTFKVYDTMVIPIYPDTFQMDDGSPINTFNRVPINGNIYMTNNILDISLGELYDYVNTNLVGNDDYFNPYLLYRIANIPNKNYTKNDGTTVLYTYGTADRNFNYYNIDLCFNLINIYQKQFDIFNAVLDICYHFLNFHLYSGIIDSSSVFLDLSSVIIDVSYNNNNVSSLHMDISSVRYDISSIILNISYNNNDLLLNLPFPPRHPPIIGNLIIPNIIFSQTVDVPLNNYTINIANSATISQDGYTLDEYVHAINFGINHPVGFVDDQFPKYDVCGSELYGSTFYVDPTTSYPYLDLKINRHFDTTRWCVNLSPNTFFYSIFGGVNGFYNDPSYNIHITNLDQVDLSVNRVIYSYIPLSGVGYSFNYGTLAIISPNRNYPTGNFFAPDIIVENSVGISQYQRFGSYISLQNAINGFFRKFVDTENNPVLYGSNVTMALNENGIQIDITLTFNINVYLTQDDYNIVFYDGYNSWKRNFGFDASYILNDYPNTDQHIYSIIKGKKQVFEDNLIITNNNNTIVITPAPDTNGLSTPNNTNDYVLTIPDGIYSRNSLIYTIQQLFSNHPTGQLKNCVITFDIVTSSTVIKFTIDKVYTGKDYVLDFYDPYSFSACIPRGGIKNGSISNTSWDSTLGWILGFRNSTSYILADYAINGSNLCQLTGDTSLSVSIYSYFMIILDDFNQNRLNDGLVTTSRNETSLTTPKYLNKTTLECDPITGQVITGSFSAISQYNNLTQKQIYAAQTIIDTQNNVRSSYSAGPFSNDVFALVPMKVSGLANNSTYVEFGGTLQNQERAYFGPVNITRMAIQLMNDKGELVDLNGSNWSFSLICEQLYQNTALTKK